MVFGLTAAWATAANRRGFESSCGLPGINHSLPLAGKGHESLVEY